MSNLIPDDIARFGWLRPGSPLGRARLGLLAALTVLTGAAWALTVYQALSMNAPMEGMSDMAMSGMPAAGWSFASAGVFLGVWTVMMAAMMLPATAPMILVFVSAQAQHERPTAVPTWTFVAGYLLVWLVAGAVVYVLGQVGSNLATLITPTDLVSWKPIALGATLVAAGLYQFTPLKRVCLSHCRSPLAFVAQHWRDGRLGALQMGISHGTYCLGCCWALFAVLVAAGLMSLAWMLLLTLVVFVEKVVPQGQRISTAIGIAFVGLGIMVATGLVANP